MVIYPDIVSTVHLSFPFSFYLAKCDEVAIDRELASYSQLLWFGSSKLRILLFYRPQVLPLLFYTLDLYLH